MAGVDALLRVETMPSRCPHCRARSLIRDRNTDAWTQRNLVLICLLCARRVLVGPERPVPEEEAVGVQALMRA